MAPELLYHLIGVGKVQGQETSEGLGITPSLLSPYLPGSLLQPPASGVVPQASPELVHFLWMGSEVTEISTQSSVVLISPSPRVGLTSREALARSCSVGHFYSQNTGKNREVKGEGGKRSLLSPQPKDRLSSGV